MSISQALSNATSGLGAASRQASVVSQNIANALTPGYSRREVSLAEQTVAGQGAGVRVAGIDRAATPALTAERRSADGAAARDSARLQAAEKISSLFGGPEDAGSLFAQLSAFDRSLRALANGPASLAAQQTAASAAKRLASSVASLSQSIGAIRQDADRSIGAEVAQVNRSLQQIERLNGEIEKATVQGRDASALLDERDRQIDGVNRAVPVRVLTRDNGRVDLITQEGAPLIAGSARQLSFSPAPLFGAGQTYANGALSGLVVDGVEITPGVSSRSIAGGSLAGLFSVRDEIGAQASDELDAFAAGLINRFAQAGLDPTASPGAPGLFTDGGNALLTPFAPGLAGRLALNAAVDPEAGGVASRLRDGLYSTAPGPVGSNVLLSSLVDALDAPQAQTFADGRLLTALEAGADLTALRGASLSRLDSEAIGSSAYAAALADAELSETGVDTDAELQRLLLIEQAYAANARVIEVTSRLINQLTEL